MSIRMRLIWMCLVVALLPALPLSFLVKSLLDTSFDVGLNPALEQGLHSGLLMSRQRLEDIRRDFFVNVQRVCDTIDPARLDSADSVEAAAALARVPGAGYAIDGVIVSQARGPGAADDDLPPVLAVFRGYPVFASLVDNRRVIAPRDPSRSGFSFFDTDDRAVLLAVWDPGRDVVSAVPPPSILFYKQNDPAFLADAGRIIEAGQKFAELRLTQRPLAESFFFPFVVIYGVCLAIALGFAMLMAERLADPIRRLVRGADAVAGGDWSVRLDTRAGGETGRLVRAFNTMVGRLDSQRRRLTEMEKMATWRDMARHLAHEIKNPLLPIRLTVEELRDQYKGDNPQYKSLLEDSARVVGDELGSLNNLVREFSEFSKMPDMNPVRGSLDDLVRDVIRLYARIEIVYTPATSIPGVVFDPDQIRRVLVNLFDNAVSVGATRVTVTLTHERDDHIAIAVADNGPGFDGVDAGRIFEPYYTTRSEGTGLGLAMVNKIVLLHGGSITAAGAPGGGAVFEMRLPVSGPAQTRHNGTGNPKDQEE